MGECSVHLAESVGYQNAGTMEYLVDRHGNFYFMEMNTRIQVEHPVTEEVYSCDLVKEQILIAAGAHLSEHVANAQPRGHAIECRINAEDPAKNFLPSPGKIDLYYAPGGHGIRIDSHVYSNYTIPSNYDSMIAKLICVGYSRESAIRRMRRALGEYLISGIKTTIPFQLQIMEHPDFISGEFDTSFVEKMIGPKRIELK
jgi:acetyl-CoA carboxylase biotin carboxylase subunit